MSAKAKGTNSRTLLLEARELATLLAGCGIEGLYLPGSVSQAVVAESDVTESMMGLVRAGLMVQAPDGILDYADDLRDTLRLLRDCRASVLLWTSWLGDQPRYLHLCSDRNLLVEVMDDPLRPGSVRVRTVGLAPWCQALISACAKAEAEPADAFWPLPSGVEVGHVSGPGALFSAWCFRRGSGHPWRLVRALRLRSGSVLAVDPGNVYKTIPLDGPALVELLKEADAT